MNILVVDDDEMVRRALERAFKPSGHRVLAASGGAKALELLAIHEIAAVISDYLMPEMTGLELMREVKRLLRPGGTFTIVDAPNGTQLPAPNRVWLDFDAQFNCEPYSPAFVATDFQALLADEGLRVTECGPTGGFLMRTASVKPV